MQRILFSLAAAAIAAANYITTPEQLRANSFAVPFINATYDFLIIGGGTAGLTTAWKLAQNPGISVAVVEAGGFYQMDNGNGSVIPGLVSLQHIGSDPSDTLPTIDWDFVTEPQEGLQGRRLRYARGKTLGGSSARAHGAFMRGTSGTYQKWAEQVNDTTFTFDKLLPYFKSSCTLTPPDLAKRWPLNGTVSFDKQAYASGKLGPLQISWPNWAIPIGSWAQTGFEKIGISVSQDGFSSGRLSGSAWMPGTINPLNSHRSSSQTSFLEDAIENTSLKVYTRTLATRIVFDDTKRATGVQVRTMGKDYHLTARKEVILSAGVFKSPQLLMLSGIGPKQHLEDYGIPVIHNLSGVGQSLHDKTYVGVSYRVNVETSSSLNDPAYAAKASLDYLNSQQGPLTNGPAFVAFEQLSPDLLSTEAQRTLGQHLTADWPHVEYLVENGFDGDNRNYATSDPQDGYNYATISAAIQGALSVGNVTLRSANPEDSLRINPAWLTHDVDDEVAVAAFKRVRQVWQAMAGVTIGDEYYPGKNVVTDEQILDHIRKASITMWHACGTCKMGKLEDPMAVVDAQGKVFGVQGLRVVDGSTFPFLLPGHPLATVYALALKIADDILSEL